MNVWELGLLKPLNEFILKPDNIPAIEQIYACYAKDEKMSKVMEKTALQDERFRKLYEQWYEPKKYTLDDLLSLPKESLGFSYGTHMKKYNLDLDFINPFPERNVLSYMWLRAAHVHDITHAILGYDTSLEGELGLKGFEIAQYHSPATAAILGAGILSVTSHYPTLTKTVLTAIVDGYQRGRNSPVLAGIKWDEEFEVPLNEVRARLERDKTRPV